LLDPNAAEVLADVDEDAVALALAVETGAAGAEGDGDIAVAAKAEHLGDVVGTARLDHGPREEPVGAGVGGVGDEVTDTVQDAIVAEQLLELAAQRLIHAAGERVGRAILDRLARRRRERTA